MTNNTLCRIGSQNSWATESHFLGNPTGEPFKVVLRQSRRDPYLAVKEGHLASAIGTEINRLPFPGLELLYLIATYKLDCVKKPLVPVGYLANWYSKRDRIFLDFENGSLRLRLKVKDKVSLDSSAPFDLLVVAVT